MSNAKKYLSLLVMIKCVVKRDYILLAKYHNWLVHTRDWCRHHTYWHVYCDMHEEFCVVEDIILDYTVEKRNMLGLVAFQCRKIELIGIHRCQIR